MHVHGLADDLTELALRMFTLFHTCVDELPSPKHNPTQKPKATRSSLR
jgi:hypothetical protein